MRFCKFMQTDRQLRGLGPIVNTQLRTRLAYEIGETLYSGPASKYSNCNSSEDVSSKCLSGVAVVAEVHKETLSTTITAPQANSFNCILPLSPTSPTCTTFGVEQETNCKGDTKCLTQIDPHDSCIESSVKSFCREQPTGADSLLIRTLKRTAIGRHTRNPLKSEDLVATGGAVSSSDESDCEPLRLEDDSGDFEELAKTASCASNSVVNFNDCLTVQGDQGSSDINVDVCTQLKQKNLLSDTQSNDLIISEKNELSHNTLSEFKKDMVRLIQEPYLRTVENCPKRALRMSKRLSSVDQLDCLIDKNAAAVTAARGRRVRRYSCRSDLSDSDYSDGCSVSEELVRPKVLDKSKIIKPKNGEPPFDIVHQNPNDSVKCNGEINVVNGVINKLKHRRLSRANSDDSDNNSCSQLNGLDPNNDRVDINLLLEISTADRKKFETKKAKIKRKTADWILITETEQYYNEKEEILRNKNRMDSETESEEESGAVCDPLKLEADSSEIDSEAEIDRVSRSKRKSCKGNIAKDVFFQKESKSEGDRECNPLKRVRGRPKGSKNKRNELKNLYLPDEEGDTSDDLSSKPLSRNRDNDESKEFDKKNKKRLSDAERFLRDNREYYMFPETCGRLRRDDKGHDAHSGESRQKISNLMQPNIDAACASPLPPVQDLFGKEVHELYFSFEGVPKKESWYQTYHRFLEGKTYDNFSCNEPPLKFVLPYEMPKEYIRELHAKKSLLNRKRSELADLVRKSPRCHASTLALFSHLLPKKKLKGVTKNKVIKQDDTSSDGTSTPVTDSAAVKGGKVEIIGESDEEYSLIAHCMQQIMRNTIEEPLLFASADAQPHKAGRKPVPKKKTRKKKGLPLVKHAEENSPVCEDELSVDFSCSINDHSLSNSCIFNPMEILQDLDSDHILSKSPSQIVADSCSCNCTADRLSCDDTSSTDDRSSETLSLCDSEVVDCVGINSRLVTKGRLGHKKRRKNLTGWPKQKKKKCVTASPAVSPVVASEDNDSDACEKTRHSSPHRDSKKDLRYLRASPRKRSTVLYADNWPLRFRKGKSLV